MKNSARKIKKINMAVSEVSPRRVSLAGGFVLWGEI